MTKKVLTLYKKSGETPLECLERFRTGSPEYAGIPLSYVGRLDPLAEGILLVVSGEENKNRLNYLGLPKEYEFDVLFGVATDTGDPLGLVKSILPPIENPVQAVREKSISFVGSRLEPYPSFSSRTVQGKPLFEWAKEGRLSEIEIPLHKVTIFSLDVVSSKSWTKEVLLAAVSDKIASVKGDFRQSDCLRSWQEALSNIDSNQLFFTITMRAYVGSGAYMRVLSEQIGQVLGLPALAFHIKRTKIGTYDFDESVES